MHAIALITQLITIFSGALGLNGGIADVGSLADCLAAINDDKADESILGVYNQVRREKWKSHIDPTSRQAMKLVNSDPSDIIPDHPVYKMSKMLETNPSAIKARHGPVQSQDQISNHDGLG